MNFLNVIYRIQLRYVINIFIGQTARVVMLHVIRTTSIMSMLKMWPSWEWIFIAFQSAGRG